jgi:hypothetical protein
MRKVTRQVLRIADPADAPDEMHADDGAPCAGRTRSDDAYGPLRRAAIMGGASPKKAHLSPRIVIMHNPAWRRPMPVLMI